MQITTRTWNNYIARLSRLNEAAGQKMREYIRLHGTDDTEALISYAYAVTTRYGEGSAELACQMYDALAEAEGMLLPTAEPAATASYGEVARMVHATKDQNPENLPSGVSRLVKRAGADTTLHNAVRDGAEWAWVPHGDTCPFCITLASRGWQTASQKLLKNGHAEHIHSNCDCEFAVRFHSGTSVAGYDPEAYLRQYRDAGSDINNWRRIDYAARKDVINAQKRAAYAAQAYRKDRGAVSEISLIRRSEEVKLSVRQVESYKTPVYVSEQATIKPKTLHRINQNTEKALEQWGVSLDRKPKIIVVGDNELRGAVGIYDPCENIVYYAESIGKKAVQDASGGFGAIEAHEMWHMKQAEDFRQSGWVITRENRAEYLDALCQKCKGRIDKLGITRDNVRELSQYAADMYLGERFDEVEAEFMSLRRRK
jgi:hypothetical protein